MEGCSLGQGWRGGQGSDLEEGASGENEVRQEQRPERGRATTTRLAQEAALANHRTGKDANRRGSEDDELLLQISPEERNQILKDGKSNNDDSFTLE